MVWRWLKQTHFSWNWRQRMSHLKIFVSNQTTNLLLHTSHSHIIHRYKYRWGYFERDAKSKRDSHSNGPKQKRMNKQTTDSTDMKEVGGIYIFRRRLHGRWGLRRRLIDWIPVICGSTGVGSCTIWFSVSMLTEHRAALLIHICFWRS